MAIHDAIAALIGSVVFVLATLLPIINPPGGAPIFLSMTPGLSDVDRTKLAGRIATNSCVLLVSAMMAGSYVLMFLGLSLTTIRIAGGIVVMATAWRLISAGHGPREPADLASVSPTDTLAAGSFYPFTFPITIGPGSISVAVTLGAGVRPEVGISLTGLAGAIAGIVLVSLAVYLSYRFASRLLRVIGVTGTQVVVQLSAFILLAVGVQILCDGLIERFLETTRA